MRPQRIEPAEAQVIPPFVHIAKGDRRTSRPPERGRLVRRLPFAISRGETQLNERVAIHVGAHALGAAAAFGLLPHRRIIAVGQHLRQHGRQLDARARLVLTLDSPIDCQRQFTGEVVLFFHLKIGQRIIGFVREKRVRRGQTPCNTRLRLVNLRHELGHPHRL